MRHARRWTAVAVALVMTATACRSGGAEGPELVAHYASFEVVAGRPQRVLVGLAGSEGRVVAFGTVRFAFSYLGTRERPLPSPEQRGEATAGFRPIPGQRPDPSTGGPRWVAASEATGVYGADGARFDRAGFWRVTVTAKMGCR